MILRGLEDAGLLKLSRNETGQIIGLAFEFKPEKGSYELEGGDVLLGLDPKKP